MLLKTRNYWILGHVHNKSHAHLFDSSQDPSPPYDESHNVPQEDNDKITQKHLFILSSIYKQIKT